MAQEIGESREKWGQDVWQMVQTYAEQLKSKSDRPFWIVYAAKQDRKDPQVFRQTMKAYYQKPPLIIGVLVWYVDHSKSEFKFVPELSLPPDVPLDPTLLSNKAEDAFAGVSEKGQKARVLLS